jgi:hypothetical protein
VVTLDGSGSSDPDGDSLSYRWVIDQRPGGSTVVLSDNTSVNPTFTPDLDGEYTFSLDVNDGQVNSFTDTVVVTTTTIVVTNSKLNDTGITWGGNYPSGNNATCIGETIDEQDCKYGRDAQAAAGTLSKTGAGHAGFDFSKLDSNGNVLVSSATSWSCVKDNVTGLIWEAKTTAGSGGIHDANNTYRWGGKTHLLTAEFGTLYDDWNTLVDGTNNENLCGFTNWRVPSIEELGSIVSLNSGNPSIDTGYFPNTVVSYFWSSSPDAQGSGYAWYVDFRYGFSDYLLRSSSVRVRLVRGGQ